MEPARANQIKKVLIPVYRSPDMAATLNIRIAQ